MILWQEHGSWGSTAVGEHGCFEETWHFGGSMSCLEGAQLSVGKASHSLDEPRQYDIEVFYHASHLFSPQDVCNGPGQECFAGAGRTIQQDALCT